MATLLVESHSNRRPCNGGEDHDALGTDDVKGHHGNVGIVASCDRLFEECGFEGCHCCDLCCRQISQYQTSRCHDYYDSFGCDVVS